MASAISAVNVAPTDSSSLRNTTLSGNIVRLYVTSKPQPPLLTAILQGNVDKIPSIVEEDFHGTLKNVMGILPLVAVNTKPASTNLKIASLLIQYGADVNDTEEVFGDNLLMAACVNQNLDLVKFALDCKIDVNSKDHYGRSPLRLTLVAGNENIEIQNLLIERGANVNDQDMTGRTVLCYAARGGHTDLVVLLLKHGADPGIMDFYGRLPSDYVGMPPLFPNVTKEEYVTIDDLLTKAMQSRGEDPEQIKKYYSPPIDNLISPAAQPSTAVPPLAPAQP